MMSVPVSMRTELRMTAVVCVGVRDRERERSLKSDIKKNFQPERYDRCWG